ncbi:MAG: hypothetical protein ABH883_03500 [Candidatus Omnitrophota bacterium]
MGIMRDIEETQNMSNDVRNIADELSNLDFRNSPVESLARMDELSGKLEGYIRNVEDKRPGYMEKEFVAQQYMAINNAISALENALSALSARSEAYKSALRVNSPAKLNAIPVKLVNFTAKLKKLADMRRSVTEDLIRDENNWEDLRESAEAYDETYVLSRVLPVLIAERLKDLDMALEIISSRKKNYEDLLLAVDKMVEFNRLISEMQSALPELEKNIAALTGCGNEDSVSRAAEFSVREADLRQAVDLLVGMREISMIRFVKEQNRQGNLRKIGDYATGSNDQNLMAAVANEELYNKTAELTEYIESLERDVAANMGRYAARELSADLVPVVNNAITSFNAALPRASRMLDEYADRFLNSADVEIDSLGLRKKIELLTSEAARLNGLREEAVNNVLTSLREASFDEVRKFVDAAVARKDIFLAQRLVDTLLQEKRRGILVELALVEIQTNEENGIYETAEDLNELSDINSRMSALKASVDNYEAILGKIWDLSVSAVEAYSATAVYDDFNTLAENFRNNTIAPLETEAAAIAARIDPLLAAREKAVNRLIDALLKGIADEAGKENALSTLISDSARDETAARIAKAKLLGLLDGRAFQEIRDIYSSRYPVLDLCNESRVDLRSILGDLSVVRRSISELEPGSDASDKLLNDFKDKGFKAMERVIRAKSALLDAKIERQKIELLLDAARDESFEKAETLEREARVPNLKIIDSLDKEMDGYFGIMAREILLLDDLRAESYYKPLKTAQMRILKRIYSDAVKNRGASLSREAWESILAKIRSQISALEGDIGNAEKKKDSMLDNYEKEALKTWIDALKKSGIQYAPFQDMIGSIDLVGIKGIDDILGRVEAMITDLEKQMAGLRGFELAHPIAVVRKYLTLELSDIDNMTDVTFSEKVDLKINARKRAQELIDNIRGITRTARESTRAPLDELRDKIAEIKAVFAAEKNGLIERSSAEIEAIAVENDKKVDEVLKSAGFIRRNNLPSDLEKEVHSETIALDSELAKRKQAILDTVTDTAEAESGIEALQNEINARKNSVLERVARKNNINIYGTTELDPFYRQQIADLEDQMNMKKNEVREKLNADIQKNYETAKKETADFTKKYSDEHNLDRIIGTAREEMEKNAEEARKRVMAYAEENIDALRGDLDKMLSLRDQISRNREQIEKRKRFFDEKFAGISARQDNMKGLLKDSEVSRLSGLTESVLKRFNALRMDREIGREVRDLPDHEGAQWVNRFFMEILSIQSEIDALKYEFRRARQIVPEDDTRMRNIGRDIDFLEKQIQKTLTISLINMDPGAAIIMRSIRDEKNSKMLVRVLAARLMYASAEIAGDELVISFNPEAAGVVKSRLLKILPETVFEEHEGKILINLGENSADMVDGFITKLLRSRIPGGRMEVIPDEIIDSTLKNAPDVSLSLGIRANKGLMDRLGENTHVEMKKDFETAGITSTVSLRELEKTAENQKKEAISDFVEYIARPENASFREDIFADFSRRNLENGKVAVLRSLSRMLSGEGYDLQNQNMIFMSASRAIDRAGDLVKGLDDAVEIPAVIRSDLVNMVKADQQVITGLRSFIHAGGLSDAEKAGLRNILDVLMGKISSFVIAPSPLQTGPGFFQDLYSGEIKGGYAIGKNTIVISPVFLARVAESARTPDLNFDAVRQETKRVATLLMKECLARSLGMDIAASSAEGRFLGTVDFAGESEAEGRFRVRDLYERSKKQLAMLRQRRQQTREELKDVSSEYKERKKEIDEKMALNTDEIEAIKVDMLTALDLTVRSAREKEKNRLEEENTNLTDELDALRYVMDERRRELREMQREERRRLAIRNDFRVITDLGQNGLAERFNDIFMDLIHGKYNVNADPEMALKTPLFPKEVPGAVSSRLKRPAMLRHLAQTMMKSANVTDGVEKSRWSMLSYLLSQNTFALQLDQERQIPILLNPFYEETEEEKFLKKFGWDIIISMKKKSDKLEEKILEESRMGATGDKVTVQRVKVNIDGIDGYIYFRRIMKELDAEEKERFLGNVFSIMNIDSPIGNKAIGSAGTLTGFPLLIKEYLGGVSIVPIPELAVGQVRVANVEKPVIYVSEDLVAMTLKESAYNDAFLGIVSTQSDRDRFFTAFIQGLIKTRVNEKYAVLAYTGVIEKEAFAGNFADGEKIWDDLVKKKWIDPQDENSALVRADYSRASAALSMEFDKDMDRINEVLKSDVEEPFNKDIGIIAIYDESGQHIASISVDTFTSSIKVNSTLTGFTETLDIAEMISIIQNVNLNKFTEVLDISADRDRSTYAATKKTDIARMEVVQRKTRQKAFVILREYQMLSVKEKQNKLRDTDYMANVDWAAKFTRDFLSGAVAGKIEAKEYFPIKKDVEGPGFGGVNEAYNFATEYLKSKDDTQNACGYMPEDEHRTTVNGLNSQIKTQIVKYAGLLGKTRAQIDDIINDKSDLEEWDVDEALSVKYDGDILNLRDEKYRGKVLKEKLAALRELTLDKIRNDFPGTPAQEAKLFFLDTPGREELFWVGDKYASAHLGRSKRRVFISLPFLINSAKRHNMTVEDVAYSLAKHEMMHLIDENYRHEGTITPGDLLEGGVPKGDADKIWKILTGKKYIEPDGTVLKRRIGADDFKGYEDLRAPVENMLSAVPESTDTALTLTKIARIKDNSSIEAPDQFFERENAARKEASGVIADTGDDNPVILIEVDENMLPGDLDTQTRESILQSCTTFWKANKKEHIGHKFDGKPIWSSSRGKSYEILRDLTKRNIAVVPILIKNSLNPDFKEKEGESIFNEIAQYNIDAGKEGKRRIPVLSSILPEKNPGRKIITKPDGTFNDEPVELSGKVAFDPASFTWLGILAYRINQAIEENDMEQLRSATEEFVYFLSNMQGGLPLSKDLLAGNISDPGSKIHNLFNGNVEVYLMPIEKIDMEGMSDFFKAMQAMARSL